MARAGASRYDEHKQYAQLIAAAGNLYHNARASASSVRAAADARGANALPHT